MERVGKEDLKKITDLLKKADIEAIATETGFSISYVRKVLYGTKSNIKILISASERAILKKKEHEDT
jgi:ABC-type Zn uptake system ZnuABC Zn-binding protein ZnuA